MPSRKPQRRVETQSYLLGLVAAVVIPLLLFAGFVLHRFADAERARYERDAAQIARQVALVIDGQMAGLLASLQGLAAASSLATGDLAVFHEEARRLVAGSDAIVLLREPGPRQILNTQRAFGESLPPAVPIPEADLASLKAGRSLVGDLYLSPLSGEARVPLALPILRGGDLAYILAMTVPTKRFRDALAPAVPPGWTVGIGDRQGTVVTRSARHEEVTGRPGLAEYLAKATGRSGTFESTGFDGTRILAGYFRSEQSEWLYAANIPEAVAEAPIWRSVGILVVLGAVALGLSALMAYGFGAGITAAAEGLADRAAALGEGRPAPPLATRLAEFATVGDALHAAAAAVEKRTRELETVLAAVPAAVWFTYDPEVRIVRNRFAGELMRLPLDEMGSSGPARTSFNHLTILKDGTEVPVDRTPLSLAMRGESVQDEEYTLSFADGTSRTMLASATPLRGEGGAIIGAVLVGLDITDRKRGEEQRRLLVHELNHRVKNTLATVQSIALQTLRSAGSLPEARIALSDRLVALAKAHDTLTRESWEGADLKTIVSAATLPHGGPDRFAVAGPPVWLPPALSLSLALSLHELATNAAKYGALSGDTGQVRILWELFEEAGGPHLRLRWIEEGGPRVRPPARQGFGTRLIERSFQAETGGRARLDYAPGGLVCTIETPLLQEAPPAARERPSWRSAGL